MKGLASDGGLFIPEEIPSLPSSWESEWQDLSFAELAHRIMSLYVDESPLYLTHGNPLLINWL
jgi:threonine synthase